MEEIFVGSATVSELSWHADIITTHMVIQHRPTPSAALIGS